MEQMVNKRVIILLTNPYTYDSRVVNEASILKEDGFKVNLTITERLTDEILSLPVHPNVSEDDINYIINAFEELSK